MNIPETYDYLVRARRDLWATLEGVPDEVLSRPLLDGSRFHCIKDLVMYVPAVEDSWIHEDILRDQPVRKTIPALRNTGGGPVYAGFGLETLLNYWRVVEHSTLTYLATLTDDELKRLVIVHDSPGEERFTVDGLLWHVMIHEMRHTAQIGVLLRPQGIKPPFLDHITLLQGVPSAAQKAGRRDGAHAGRRTGGRSTILAASGARSPERGRARFESAAIEGSPCSGICGDERLYVLRSPKARAHSRPASMIARASRAGLEKHSS